MSLDLAAVTFDCDDPQQVAAFWKEALGRTIDDGASAFFVSLSGGPGAPKLFFIKVPEPKTVKNRVHLDLHTADRAVEVDRLLALGATRVADHEEHGIVWTTLRDVEGNEFCVAAD
ncbi:MAG: VOC family protein [Acidimicrobiales bacterium]|nr:VOC family protein [Acidimicrobiales bacterium]